MNMKRLLTLTAWLAAVSLPVVCWAQVNTGSNGSDGAFNPTTNIVVDMSDHLNGIYQYTAVNIPTNVTVTFIPNANNTPVTWLVQSSSVINGFLNLPGQNASGSQGGMGGPGGWSGGNGGTSLTSGQGPGGGQAGGGTWGFGANASYGSRGFTNDASLPPGPTYGNAFLIPLLGGSGGGGGTAYSGVGGGGGGGAITIAASSNIVVNGTFVALGGDSGIGSANNPYPAGGGSGGAVRLVASRVAGAGQILTDGGRGSGSTQPGYPGTGRAGAGRVRFDTYQNAFSGSISGVFSQGLQPIITPSPGQGAQLTVTSIGGIPVSASPTGVLSTPDAILSAQQASPIPVVVQCANLPLNTAITVSLKPMNGTSISAIGYNNTGTLASSTATALVVMPRGGGLIYATASTAN